MIANKTFCLFVFISFSHIDLFREFCVFCLAPGQSALMARFLFIVKYIVKAKPLNAGAEDFSSFKVLCAECQAEFYQIKMDS